MKKIITFKTRIIFRRCQVLDDAYQNFMSFRSVVYRVALAVATPLLFIRQKLAWKVQVMATNPLWCVDVKQALTATHATRTQQASKGGGKS